MDFPLHVQKFFIERKISRSVLTFFGVHWNGQSIVYPIKNVDGKVIFNVYRRDPAKTEGVKYWYDRGSKVSLYGIDKIKDSPTVLICEGPNDCLAAWSEGIPAVTSTGGALSFQKEWVEYFVDKEVIICLDSDEAGGKGMVKILELIPTAKILFLPEGNKDICDFTTNGGKLSEILPAAKQFLSLSDVQEDRSNRIGYCKQTYFHDAWIKHHTKPIKVVRTRDPVMGDKVARAKSYPITELLQFNSVWSIRCPFHNETEASLHYYKDQNKTWCFGGCGRGYDSIDIYQKLHNVSFMEAVKALQ